MCAFGSARAALDAAARQHRIPYFEATITREAARVEAAHRDWRLALRLFDQAIEALHRAGSLTLLAIAFGFLLLLFDELDRPETVATIYGTTTGHRSIAVVAKLPAVVEQTKAVLGVDRFEDLVEIGTSIDTAAAVDYVRRAIEVALGVGAQDRLM